MQLGEELADQVWEAWNAGVIDDLVAAWLWCAIVGVYFNSYLKYQEFSDSTYRTA